MKKIVTFILLMGMILTFAACGKAEITAQEIYDAGQIEAMLQNHQSICIRIEMDGELFDEDYLTKEFAYTYIPGEEFDYAEFMTDDAHYVYNSGDYLRYLYITPAGVTNDFTGDRAERYEPVLTADIVDETIETVSRKDGRIIVNSVLREEVIAELAEEGITSGKTQYALDAKTKELISVIADYTYTDGVFHMVTEVAYDAEAPETLEVFEKYASQTEDLRNITVVTNPGSDKEISQNFRIPKGLVIGFTWNDAFEDKVELYADAACTALYDPYMDTDSDIAVYIKWNE